MRWGRTAALAVVLPLVGCGGIAPVSPDDAGGLEPDGGTPDGGPADPTALLFDPGHVVQIRVDLVPDDWAALRTQTRSLIDVLYGDCAAAPFPSPFTYFTGTVTVDGVTLPNVGVRKKGFIGSLSVEKPSLKLKIDHVIGSQRAFGMDGLTLNNARQDPALVRQCLGYALFARAGIPSPRCNFAHVVVNGEDLGVYAHVEDVDRDFLRRHFTLASGNLYEGTLSDFDPAWLGTFDLKTNETIADRSDLLAVTEALAAPDGELVARLEPLVELDELFDYWAMESIVRQWDGYAGNTNNFFVYRDPESSKFWFLPWGIDGTFDPTPPDLFSNRPLVIMTKGALARRLYGLPATRTRYLDRVRALLGEVWDEPTLLAEIDRMQRLVTPHVPAGDATAFRAALDEVRTFVRGRRQAVLSALAAPPAGAEARSEPPCLRRIGTISGSFSTTWGTLDAVNPFASGTGTLTATVDGVPLAVSMVGSTAGLDTSGSNGPQAGINLVLALADGSLAAAVLRMPPAHYAPNVTLPFDLVTATGLLFGLGGDSPTVIGLLGPGSLRLEAAGLAAGGAVRGEFSAELVAWPF